MTKLNCVIVEDEPVSQEILKRYMDDSAKFNLLAVYNNAIEASAALKFQNVDVLFLDINMPKLSGLDFYRSLPNAPNVIFTTAYPQYAIDGFEVNAVDYLVKPFPFERFMKAVNKLEALRSPFEGGFILFNADKKIHRVSISDILFAEAMGDYVKVQLADRKKLVVHMTLQRLQDQLPATRFMRVHKSYLIALSAVEYVEGNTIAIRGYKVPIGQTYRNEFLVRLQNGQ